VETSPEAASPRQLAILAAESLARYRDKDSTGQDGAGDVRTAVNLFQHALQALAHDDPQEPVYRYNLAIALQCRYDAVGEPSDDATDLHAAVAELDGALAATRDGGQQTLAALLYGLGSALRRVYSVEHDAADLERAVGLLGDALSSDDQTNLDTADCQYEYGRALLEASEIENDPDLLDKSVHALRHLVTEVDPTTHDFPAYLDAAGSAHMARFERRGRTADLRLARKLAEAAVSCQRSRGQVTAAALNNLAKVLATASPTATNGQDLDRAISLAREAIALTENATASHRRGRALELLGGLRSNLAGFLLDEMDRTNDLEAIDSIVELASQAVADTRPGTAPMANRAHQAAIAYRTRYLRFDDPADLAAALRFHKIAVNAPAAPTERLAIIDSLGNTLRTRYDASQRVTDLEMAIRAYEKALRGTGPKSPDRVARLNNLGAAQAAMADATQDERAAEAASRTLEQAVRLGAPHSSERTRALINLGNIASDRFTRVRTEALRDTAIGAYQEVRDDLRHLGHGSEQLLQAALNATELAEDAEDWAAVISWSEVALDTVDDLLVLQQRRRSKESWLRISRGAADRASRAAIAIDDLPKAVTMAERGRALLLREAIEQTRLDLDGLASVGGEALRHQVEAAQAVAQHSQTRWGDVAGKSPGPNLRELRDLIRRLPGFETFLSPTTFAQITAAAADRPLVYLSPGETQGEALVVRSGDVEHMRLPALTEDAARGGATTLFGAHQLYKKGMRDPAARQDRRREWNKALDSVAEWLWDSVAGPLVGLLGGGPVVIIAGGLSGVLPIHAAWCPEERAPTKRRYALDLLEISYTPSAAALQAATRRAVDTATQRVLTIADPKPTMLPALPSATAEAEVATWGRGAGRTSELREYEATVEGLEKALPACQLLHAGCHGIADLVNPLESGLVLADDRRFTLERLLALRTGLRLAVLSACESGRVGTSLPDEVVSLPSGLIQAGAAGVVASSWAVPDGTTLALMTEFYSKWRHGWGEPPSRALAASQAWVRDTSNGAKLDAWASRVEAGELPESTYDALQDVYLRREPSALDDSAMSDWAAFSHFGV